MGHTRDSNRMSCEASATFFKTLAIYPHIRQNLSTFAPIALKINLQEVISTYVPDITLLINVSIEEINF